MRTGSSPEVFHGLFPSCWKTVGSDESDCVYFHADDSAPPFRVFLFSRELPFSRDEFCPPVILRSASPPELAFYAFPWNVQIVTLR